MSSRPTRARSDGIDVEQFAQLVRSASFARIRARVEAQLERERLFCESASGEIELRRAQGAAQALRMVLDLPKVLLAELQDGRA